MPRIVTHSELFARRELTVKVSSLTRPAGHGERGRRHMTDTSLVLPLTADPRAEQMFPKLTPEQIARIAAHGHVRAVRPGEVLVEAGAQPVPFFLVTAGRLEIVQRSGDSETIVAAHGPGQFTGEVNMLAGRRALVSTRATEASEVIELDRESLLAFVRTDSEIGEI